ncbi:indigoidine synthase A family protein [Galdieria sulphuraria]|uniref:Indigoidine synthase A family protein n=1 Tax=Galdieria sulphuraria TaxID=130081 RepID=M2XVR6_GALSU|nr:indigoidine synthase A family protein [Galdieria sulphuraria]EME27509.1 indigoidine synthase A family protein [Galdieria sulphuraria]|eukprot:XP_005704029.1 indigoidine synthase A family protein [Galdieria sulphuraria]
MRKEDCVFSEPVRTALLKDKPVVALESTIISHGMPYPENFKTALQVEDLVKNNGAIPATIAILQGKVHVGLDRQEIEYLSKKGKSVWKCSTRDLAYVLAQKLDGATTVSATMVIAHRVGIHFFVTGGIGGAHRGSETTFDISTDLIELGRTPVCVICAGVKAILDIPKTLEVLETQGVTVITYGQEEFPAFYFASSGIRSHIRVDQLEDISRIFAMNRRWNLSSGMLVAVPVPQKDKDTADRVEAGMQQALEELKEKQLTGSAVTPFLLERIADLTGGDSLKLNIELILNNAAIGAQLARHYASYQTDSSNRDVQI